MQLNSCRGHCHPSICLCAVDGNYLPLYDKVDESIAFRVLSFALCTINIVGGRGRWFLSSSGEYLVSHWYSHTLRQSTNKGGDKM